MDQFCLDLLKHYTQQQYTNLQKSFCNCGFSGRFLHDDVQWCIPGSVLQCQVRA